jgi:hypothetical protein
VATPNGERTIGSLPIGDTVLAYGPTMGKAEPELVQHGWVNHDSDRVDVGLQGSSAATPTKVGAANHSPQAVAAALALAVSLAIGGHASAPCAHTAEVA